MLYGREKGRRDAMTGITFKKRLLFDPITQQLIFISNEHYTVHL